MKKTKTLVWLIGIIATLSLAACGGGGSGSATTDSDTTGILSLSMVDAPGGDYQAVYVSIKEVLVCYETGTCDGDSEECECQWETIATPQETYNLLELVNGVMAALGKDNLQTGTYNQMRMILQDMPDDSLNMLGQPHPYAQYLIDMDDQTHEMKVPSGYQSGIKLVHPFEIIENTTTELILDFDVSRSVIKAGKSGKYILKPTIKIIGTSAEHYVSGVVRTADDAPAPVAGAQVTAWYQDSEDNWQAAAGTMTDETGAYTLFLAPEDYIIVASADGRGPECANLTVQADQSYPETDFLLAPAQMVTATGTISGTAPLVDGAFPLDAPVVTVSFSQIGDCFPDPVETNQIQATDDGDDNTADIFYNSQDGTFQYSYSIDLAAGTYGVTASTDGLEPIEASLDASTSVELDFDFF